MTTQIRQSKPKPNVKKLEAVILYFLNKLGALDKQKLELLLYFMDFDYYERTEKFLTGFTYIKKV